MQMTSTQETTGIHRISDLLTSIQCANPYLTNRRVCDWMKDSFPGAEVTPRYLQKIKSGDFKSIGTGTAVALCAFINAFQPPSYPEITVESLYMPLKDQVFFRGRKSFYDESGENDPDLMDILEYIEAHDN